MEVTNVWKKIAANTFYQLAGKGFSIVTSVVATALITRSLGVTQYGEFILVTTVPTFLFLFGDFGLNAVFLREVAKDNHHTRKFGSLLSLRLGLSVLLFLLGAAYALLFPLPPLVRTGILIALVAIFTQGVFTSLNALFQHHLRYDLSVLAGIFYSLSFLIAAVWGFLNQAGFLFFVEIWAASTLVLVIAALLFSLKLPERPRFSWDRVWVKRLFLAALPLGLMLIFAQINAKADVFLLRALDSASSVGIYRLAYSVFENILPIPIFFVNALYPVMLQDQKQSVRVLWERLKKSLGILVFSAVALLVLGVAFAPWVISILGGEPFQASTTVLRLLLLALPIFFLTAPLQWFLITVGKEKVLPLIYAVAAVTNVAVNLLFIPRFSYFASIFATIFCEVTVLVLLVVEVFKFRRRIIPSSK